MTNNLEITLNLTNQKVQFTGVSKSNPDRPVRFDFFPPVGDGDGFRGLELLVMSLTGCVGTAIVYLLRKTGKDISGFKVVAKDEKGEDPLSVQRIRLEVTLESKDAVDSDLGNVIKQAEEVSPVWKMLKNTVEVVPEYKIITV